MSTEPRRFPLGNALRGMRPVLLMGGTLFVSSTAHAGSIDLGAGIHGTYKLNLSYGVAMRTESPSNALINGPVDQFQSTLYVVPTSPGPGQPPQVFRFTHTGLPTTINFDDGDRNFKKYSLVNNRVTAFGEFEVKWKNYGFVGSGDAFYDQGYHRPNGNASPRTVNKLGPNGEYPDPAYNQFTDATRYFDGDRARILEAYGYGDWNFGSQSSLDLRIGRQLVAWGQSLFFSGLALTQSRADATKGFVPGADVKSILLPTNQVAVRLGLTTDWTLLAYYKLEFAATELFPEGDYFSPADAIGPGATFVYGSANPLAGASSCQGLVQNFHITNIAVNGGAPAENLVCNVLGLAGGLGNAVPFIPAVRGPDLKPSNGGQYGVGTEYQITPITTIGFYYLRYDDNNPTVQLNVGFAPFTSGPNPITTQIINQPVPTSYNVKYFDGIHMFSAGFSTVLGPINVGGEFNFRDGAPTAVTTDISGVISPVFTRAKISQLLLSTLYVANPNLYFDDLVFVGEAGAIHVNSVDQVKPTPGIIPVGDGRQLFYSKNSWGFEMLIRPTKHNIYDGWDMSTPLSFSMLAIGNPALAGGFGALYGQGDKRLGIAVNFQYLQNLKIGLGYNFFFGDPNKLIGQSNLHANPYVDRDYATLNIAYNLF